MHCLRSALLATFMLTSLLVFGQGNDIKFGKVDKEDLEMTELASDTSAEAYVLYDIADNSFEYNGQDIQFITRTHRRVKLFKRSSFEMADVKLRRYKQTTNLSKIKAAIHLPDGSSIELKGKDFIKEDEDDDYESIRFTFPQVTEGAIIEYTYTRYTTSIETLPKYFFQESIPVRWAEYLIYIPEYFRYVSLSNASRIWAVDESSTINGSFGSTNVQLSKIRYALSDLAGYDTESYTNNFQDFIPHIFMRLAGTRFPQQPYNPYLKDWPTVAKELDEYEKFGRMFNSAYDVNNITEAISADLATATTALEKATIAYQAITRKMKWNGETSWAASQSLKKSWDAGTGNSADPNLMLLGVLRQLDITADPLLVGYRNNGTPITFYPIISQFDHVMVLAQIDGKEMILDAGSAYRPMGLPRFSALNGSAWVANENNPRWIDVNVPQMNSTTVADIQLKEDGMATVKVQTRMDGYYSLIAHDELDDMEDDNQGPIMTDVLAKFPEAIFVSREVGKTENTFDPLKFDLEMEVPVGVAGDDLIYVSPILVPALTRELADNEARYTPIDFGYAWKKRYIAKLSIPAGYAVEELPPSVRVSSEDGTINYLFTTGADQQAININLTVEVERSLFAAEEYQALRELFKRILEVQDSIVVLKKAK